MTYRLAALCAGTGALEMGLQLTGVDFELVWYSEIDPHASKVLAHHHPHVPNLGDLTKITDPPAVDIVTAGFPCTDISPAGKRAGIEGEHSGLWWDIAGLVGRLRPRFIVLENSADIAHRGGVEVVGSLTELGYDCRWTTLRAADIGAPHGRPRWFCVATDTDQRRLPGLEELDGTPIQRPALQLRDDVDGCRMGRHGAGIHRPVLEPARDGRHLLAGWAEIVGRSAPHITDAADIREWMMGLPEGHVTGVPDLSRAQMLKILGNGCVPAQCAAAIKALGGAS